MSKKVRPKDLRRTLTDIFGAYYDEIKQAIPVCSEEIAKEAVTKLKTEGDFADRSGEYRKSFKQSRTASGGNLIYVKDPHYRLTHLLENGHAINSGTGRSAQAFPHWKPVEEWVADEFEKRLTKKLEALI